MSDSEIRVSDAITVRPGPATPGSAQLTVNAETADLTPEQARDLLAALIHWQIAAVMGDNESDEAPSMITVIRRTDVADTPEPAVSGQTRQAEASRVGAGLIQMFAQGRVHDAHQLIHDLDGSETCHVIMSMTNALVVQLRASGIDPEQAPEAIEAIIRDA